MATKPKRTMKGKRILTSIYLDPPAYDALKALSTETRVSVAAYLREAVDDLLQKHRRKMPRRSKP